MPGGHAASAGYGTMVTGEAKGLVPELEAAVSITERHMVVKVWRALWKKMAAMKYCELAADPGKSFANTPPLPRDQIWRDRKCCTWCRSPGAANSMASQR